MSKKLTEFCHHIWNNDGKINLNGKRIQMCAEYFMNREAWCFSISEMVSFIETAPTTASGEKILFFSLDETSNYLKGLSLPGCFYVWVWVCGLKYYRYKTVIIYMRCESAYTFSQSTKLPCWFACTVCTYYTHISCNEMYFFSSFYSTYI